MDFNNGIVDARYVDGNYVELSLEQKINLFNECKEEVKKYSSDNRIYTVEMTETSINFYLTIDNKRKYVLETFFYGKTPNSAVEEVKRCINAFNRYITN